MKGSILTSRCYRRLILYFILLMPTMVAAQNFDVKGSKDYAVVPRMSNFYIDRYDDSESDYENFKTNNGRIRVEGRKIVIDYRIQPGVIPPGKIQILHKHQTILNNYNAETLLKGPYYDVFKFFKDGSETWIKVDPGIYDGKRYTLTIVEKPGKALGSSPLVKTVESVNRKILTTLEIIPTLPYSGYIKGKTMEWPDGFFSNQLFVTAHFSDGSITPAYTGSIVWGSDNAAAKISSSGLFTSGSVGKDTTVTVTVSESDVRARLVINILDGDLTVATIISDNDRDLIHDGDYNVAVGNTEQWRCLCKNSTSKHQFDLTRDVNWSSEAPNTIAVDNSDTGGQVSRLSSGTTVIFCSIERDTFNIETNAIVN